jgi:hypothetical protein
MTMYLERVGAMLAFRGRGHFTDDDVAEVAKLARDRARVPTCGLITTSQVIDQ